MNKMLVWGVVAVVVIAALGLLLYNNDDDGGDEVTCTIYVQEVGGQVMAAEMDLSPLTFSEMAVMAFGGGVRETQFLPLESYTTTLASVSQAGYYQVWSGANVKVSGTNMASLSSISANFKGCAGTVQTSGTAPNHAFDALTTLRSEASHYDVTVTRTTASFNTIYTFNHGNEKFTHYLQSTTIKQITGDNVDGAIMKLTVTATGIDTSGQTVTKTLEAGLQIIVSAWSGGSGSMSIVLTSFGAAVS
jgi:hypothetical protein